MSEDTQDLFRRHGLRAERRLGDDRRRRLAHQDVHVAQRDGLVPEAHGRQPHGGRDQAQDGGVRQGRIRQVHH